MFNRFQFFGESISELADLPPDKRRRMYWKAAGAAYRDWRTWVGIAVFIAGLLLAAWKLEAAPWIVLLVLAGCAWFSVRMHLLAMRRWIRRVGIDE